METIAVYWEPVIRTYGFHVQQGLRMVQDRSAINELPRRTDALQMMSGSVSAFRLVWAQMDSAGDIVFSLLYDPVHCTNEVLHREKFQDQRGGFAAQPEVSVDLVYFQGPHFGDRYGIMDFTFNALSGYEAPLLAVVCSVASVYLVVPANQGLKIRDMLAGAFEVPTTVRDQNRGAGAASGMHCHE